MNIRLFKSDDKTRIVAIYNQAISEGAITTDLDEVTIADKEDWFRGHDEERHPLFVIENEAGVVGWCSLLPWQSGEALAKTVQLLIFIEHGHLRKGYAEALLTHAFEHVGMAGVKHILALLLEGNRPAIQLLAKFGFKLWGHLPEVADFGPIYCGQHIYGCELRTQSSSDD